MVTKNAKKNVTFRIDPNILKKLQTESSRHVISLNSLINQILSGYIAWEKQATKSGWILMHKKVMKSFLEELDEKTISKIAAPLAKEVMTDTLLNMHNKVDLEGWITVTRERSVRSNFDFQEIHEDGKINLIITHSMGLKWSIFHDAYYKQMLRDLDCSATIEYTKDTLVISINE